MRNTPTCVGKTGDTHHTIKVNEKHPHVRGEDCRQQLFYAILDRNTPTCVGKTETPRLIVVSL